MSTKRIAACTIVLVALVAGAVFAGIDAKTEKYYGLRTIREPYQGRIRQIIGLSMVQYKAMTASGFKVYKLDNIIQANTLSKFYVWTSPDGSKLVTTHFIGTGEMFMKKGDAYLGKVSPLWLIVYRNGEEVKFTIKR